MPENATDSFGPILKKVYIYTIFHKYQNHQNRCDEEIAYMYAEINLND